MTTKVKDSNKKSESTANVFRHEKEELGVIPVCIALLAVLIGICFMNFISIVVSVSILIVNTLAFDNACKVAGYELKVHEDSLIYTSHKGRWGKIHLPCLIIQKRKGIITRKGNKIVESKVSIANLLEFNASDTDKSGRTILEFLEEVNVRYMLPN